jgi:predicted phosphodiesterase
VTAIGANLFAAPFPQHGDKPIETAGRLCPADYRYPPSVFDRPPEFAADVLYVVGGLYGNLAALDCVERLAGQEHAIVVFNGDFHWFDAEPAWFAEVEQRITRHRTIRGNVETEIARAGDIGAGCGCAYPASVAEDVVRRSNEILVELRTTARAHPDAVRRLGALPMHLVAEVGGLRVGIVHGDASTLAGWTLAHDALAQPSALATLDAARRASQVDVLASTHTCLAVLRDARLPAGRMTVINNGAAGMPNFSGSRFGLISRIASTPSPHPPLYGLVRDGVHIDAIPLGYDSETFLGHFLARWPEGSAAHASYFQRITAGPDYSVEQAMPPPATTAA